MAKKPNKMVCVTTNHLYWEVAEFCKIIFPWATMLIVRKIRPGIDTIKYHTWPRIPHGNVTKIQLNITNKSLEVSPFPACDHKAAMNRHESMTNTRLQSMVHHRKYPLLIDHSICKVWSCYDQRLRRKYIYKKVHFFTFDLDLRSRTDTKCCPASSTSYDLCTCKVWSCYVQQYRRKCIHK